LSSFGGVVCPASLHCSLREVSILYRDVINSVLSGMPAKRMVYSKDRYKMEIGVLSFSCF
jgi:hypothetical protein